MSFTYQGTTFLQKRENEPFDMKRQLKVRQQVQLHPAVHGVPLVGGQVLQGHQEELEWRRVNEAIELDIRYEGKDVRIVESPPVSTGS